MHPGPVNAGYPFSAVLGMECTKKAIVCMMVNPMIKCVLIKGRSGTAKTTIARSTAGMTDKTTVNIPLNSTEEQIFGGMDMETAINEGVVRMQKGLLSRADGNIAYIDDINLLDEKVIVNILDSVISGRVAVENGSVSDSYLLHTTLIATMNPENPPLSPHILDRFDICIEVSAMSGSEDKMEIVRRNMDYERDPESFRASFSEDEDLLRVSIDNARALLLSVTISDGLLSIVSELCQDVGAEGYRGDISTVNVARAFAAINGRKEVMKKDVEEAAALCLAHRSNSAPDPPSMNDEAEEEQSQGEDETEDGPSSQNRDDEMDSSKKEDPFPIGSPNDREKDDRDSTGGESPDPSETVFNADRQFRVIDYLQSRERSPSKTKSRKGRRMLMESSDMTGRYTRSRIVDSPHDIAFDATIMAAAPYQMTRRSDGLAFIIEKQDLREKIRKRHSGCTLLFLVDASGSLGVRKRMTAVKGAILSMLRESYVKRDRVGMMAFRRDSSEMILPPTRSVEYSYRKLEELPTGGKTPLSEALVSVRAYMESYSRSHPGEQCFIILITDGRANVSIREGNDANEEAMNLAEKMSIPGVKWIVVDAGAGYFHFDNAEKLAEKLSAKYFRLDDLNADRLAEGVRAITE